MLVLTHANPDPDSLASAAGLQLLAKSACGIDAKVGICGKIMRAENRQMLRELSLDIARLQDLEISDYDCIALVDTQPGFGHTPLPSGRAIDIVIDHHVPPTPEASGAKSGKAVAADEARPPAFADVRLDIGATSSIVASYLIDAGVEIDSGVATALYYGLTTDTGGMSRDVSALDERVYMHLIPRVDRQKIAKITKPDLPSAYFRALREALNNVRIYHNVVLCTLGETTSPEMVAEIADLLLRLEGQQTVFCGGQVGNNYYMSVRTELDRDAYYLIRDALHGEGSFGGHGRIAGGCIPLPDDSERTRKRVERRLERHILQAMNLEDVTAQGLGGSRD
jgi:nanoRNase/pAp phosphatase (c-di-AMP/oligoRNAs hydrolase)